MGKYEDFDLDMKLTSDTGDETMGTTTTTVTLSLLVCPSGSCVVCISEKNCTNNCTKGKCSDDCPTPTKDHPVGSCHLRNGNGVQIRC